MRTAWQELEVYLRGFAGTLPERPRAILAVSGHWEATIPTVNGNPAPSLIFDYSGFPEYTYQLTWPAPGDPTLAARVRELLSTAGIPNANDASRGWDHGIFVPLKVMFPRADIPVVQLSLQLGLDPGTHLDIGRALKPLRGEGVLILGSGQSYHNMSGFAGRGAPDPQSESFDAWLRNAIRDPATRDDALKHWERAPGARQSQPREDHLLPLMVAAGAASGEPGHVEFHGHALGKPISGFRFG